MDARVGPYLNLATDCLALEGQFQRVPARQDERPLLGVAGVDLRVLDQLGAYVAQVPDDAVQPRLRRQPHRLGPLLGVVALVGHDALGRVLLLARQRPHLVALLVEDLQQHLALGPALQIVMDDRALGRVLEALAKELRVQLVTQPPAEHRLHREQVDVLTRDLV